MRPPRGAVADFRRAGDACLMACAADGLHHFLAAPAAGRAAAIPAAAELDAADGLQPFGHRFRRHGVRLGARLTRDELHEQHDADDRHDEGEDDDRDELLRGLDERRMGIVSRHGGSYWGKALILAWVRAWTP